MVLTPNTVIYNTLLHALCWNGKVGRARSLMNEMVDPNEVTFNILISAYCKEENLVQALVVISRSSFWNYQSKVCQRTMFVEFAMMRNVL